MNPSNTESLVNAILQSYRLVEFLGSGAVADVYRAEDVNTKQSYAVKVMQARWLPFPHVMPRFESEARILFDLPHPHIVKAYPPLGYVELGQSRPYFVMEYLAGGSFSDYLRNGGLMTFGQAADFIAQVADALYFAHRRGVIHRDLKPANILLRERGSAQSAVLTDFGIAKIIYQAQMTNLVNQPGTPEYMAPEQFQAQEATPFSDQYALGIILYWMMTRRLPFRLSDPTPIAIQHINTIPPLPSSINNDVTPAIERVVMQALAKDPFYRFPDIMQMAQAFRQAVASSHNENVPINVLGGSRPPTGQGGYLPSTGILRMPGPLDETYRGAGPGISPSEVGVTNPLGTVPTSPSQVPQPMPQGQVFYAVLGVGLVIALLLGGILWTLLSMRPGDPAMTPTIVADAILKTEDALPPISTPVPSVTPVEEEAVTFSKTPLDTVILAATPRDRNITVMSPAAATDTEMPVPTASHTYTATASSTPTHTATATASATITQPAPVETVIVVPSLDEMLVTFNSQLGTTLTFNCKRFVETYEALQNELSQSNVAYERARALVDEADDYAVQIYEDYCRDNATDITARIDGLLYSRFRSETRQLMDN